LLYFNNFSVSILKDLHKSKNKSTINKNFSKKSNRFSVNLTSNQSFFYSYFSLFEESVYRQEYHALKKCPENELTKNSHPGKVAT